MKKPKSGPIFDTSDFVVAMVRRSILKGTGVDIEEAAEKPMIAVVNSCTELNPGHAHLGLLATKVKEGVHAAGGLPFEFNVPAPCDGLTEGNEGMRFVLPQRELIADMVETHIRSHLYDGMVIVSSCDKINPGMIMAAARLDIATIFLTGGPNCWEIRFRADREESVDNKDYDDLPRKLATATCATFGACELMGTANTTQCLAEALGLTIPGSANVPAIHTDKMRFARKSGKRIVEMIEEDLTARKILTRKAIENAVIVDLAIGGSTNSTLHLPAIAHELGIELPLSTFNDFNKKIPTLCAISPSGPWGITDLYMAGGIPAVMKMLADDLHLDALTATGQTMAQVVEEAQVLNERVIPPRDKPHMKEGGTVVLYGNLAPEGAVAKQSAVTEDMMKFTGPAQVFESESDCLKAIREGNFKDESVMVIRNEGPKGGPGMPETLAITMTLGLTGMKRIALITDGRFSGATAGPCIGHVSPEAYDGGPIAAVRDGDAIEIDIPGRTFNIKLSDDEIKKRMKDWKPVQRDVPEGFMRRYVKYVSSASKGAILE